MYLVASYLTGEPVRGPRGELLEAVTVEEALSLIALAPGPVIILDTESARPVDLGGFGPGPSPEAA